MRFTFDDDNNLQTHPREMKGWQESPAPGKKRVQYYGLVVSCLGMLLVSSLLNGEIVPRVFFADAANSATYYANARISPHSSKGSGS